MKNLKIKFWDTERKIMLESKVSCVTAFRNYLDVASETRFSDCNNQPEKSRYIPLLFTGKKDVHGRDLWDGDTVIFDLFKFYGEGTFLNRLIKCVIVYDESEACFCIKPLEIAEDFEGYPLLALDNHLEKTGNIYETNEDCFWCIETSINNQAHWWTGNIPHLSISESEQGAIMWSTDIHAAKKFSTKESAELDNHTFQLSGIITDHICEPVN